MQIRIYIFDFDHFNITLIEVLCKGLYCTYSWFFFYIDIIITFVNTLANVEVSFDFLRERMLIQSNIESITLLRNKNYYLLFDFSLKGDTNLIML